ncbi:MAG TPA: hypothetical protein VM553_12905, partial [Dongiaceae bacterium]|nr:hypothetical protein [Dongiaceae bacterium]
KPAPQPAAQPSAVKPASQPAAKPSPAPAAAALAPATAVTTKPAAPTAAKPATPAANTTSASTSTNTKPTDVALVESKPAPTAEPVITPPTPPAATDNIKVSLDNLPLSIQGQWTLDRSESRCVLQSSVQKMDDGQGGTRVQLVLSPSELTFTTESDIDTSYKGTGIRIDSSNVFPLETIERRTNLAFSRQRSALLSAMKNGQNLELALGFWPTWPVTQTYTVNIPLQHFASAYAAWETCNKLLSQR